MKKHLSFNNINFFMNLEQFPKFLIHPKHGTNQYLTILFNNSIKKLLIVHLCATCLNISAHLYYIIHFNKIAFGIPINENLL